jgi:hypothetical protein
MKSPELLRAVPNDTSFLRNPLLGTARSSSGDFINIQLNARSN